MADNMDNPRPFPTWQAVQRSYEWTLAELPRYINVAGPWIALMILGSYLQQFVLAPSPEQIEQQSLSLMQHVIGFLMTFLPWILISSCSVTWYRAILQDEYPTSPLGMLIDKRLFSYFARLVMTALIALLAAVMASIFSTVIIGFFIILVTDIFGIKDPGNNFVVVTNLALLMAMLSGYCYAFARTSIWLPASALLPEEKSIPTHLDPEADQADIRIKHAWKVTYKNGWRVMTGWIAVNLPVIASTALYMMYWFIDIGGFEAIQGNNFPPPSLDGVARLFPFLMMIVSFFVLLNHKAYTALCYDFFIRGGGPQGAGTTQS